MPPVVTGAGELDVDGAGAGVDDVDGDGEGDGVIVRDAWSGVLAGGAV